jgi:flagellar motor switch protein FliN
VPGALASTILAKVGKPAERPAPPPPPRAQAPEPQAQAAHQEHMMATAVGSSVMAAETKQYSPATFGQLKQAHSDVEARNLDILLDVPLQVTVELGKTHIPIKQILEYGQGSLITLDKLAGEPIDLLVNGKYFAKGEVVVIDENFGVRITSILSPAERLAQLG